MCRTRRRSTANTIPIPMIMSPHFPYPLSKPEIKATNENVNATKTTNIKFGTYGISRIAGSFTATRENTAVVMNMTTKKIFPYL